MEDYHGAFAHGFDESRDIEEPEPVRRVAKKAATASWKSLAAEDLEGTSPTLPIGKCFWPLSQREKRDIERLVAESQPLMASSSGNFDVYRRKRQRLVVIGQITL